MRARTPSTGGSGQVTAASLLTTASESVFGGGKGRRPSAQAVQRSSVSSRDRRASSVPWTAAFGGFDEGGGVAVLGGEELGDVRRRLAANVIRAEARDERPRAQGRLPDLAHPQADQGGERPGLGPFPLEPCPVRPRPEPGPAAQRLERPESAIDLAPQAGDLARPPSGRTGRDSSIRP